MLRVGIEIEIKIRITETEWAVQASDMRPSVMRGKKLPARGDAAIMTLMHDPRTTAALLKKETLLRPAWRMVLGSGFQHTLGEFDPAVELAYGQLPGFPTVGVTGHAGKLVFGHFDHVPVVVLKGRAHYYEGHDMERVTFPVRVLAELGVRTLLLTNAAGAVNRLYRAGDFMVLEDHINLMGANPLRGPARPGCRALWICRGFMIRGLIKLARRRPRRANCAGIRASIWRCPAPLTKLRRKFGCSGGWEPTRWG